VVPFAVSECVNAMIEAWQQPHHAGITIGRGCTPFRSRWHHVSVKALRT
jgi:hypothetical protein